jgi:hypothetical protein
MSARDAVNRIERIAYDLRDAAAAVAMTPPLDDGQADRLIGAIDSITASLDIVRANAVSPDSITDE